MTSAEMVEKIDASLLLAHGEMLNALSPEQSEATIISLDAKTIINVIARAGFALVPLEPTEEMIEAGGRAIFDEDLGNRNYNPDAPYPCDPNGCGPKAHAAHADLKAWAEYAPHAKKAYRAVIAARPGQEKEDV